MGPVTIDLKDEDEWPDSMRHLAGEWADFPEPGELRDNQAADAEREPL